jgi:hypothetical protein
VERICPLLSQTILGVPKAFHNKRRAVRNIEPIIAIDRRIQIVNANFSKKSSVGFPCLNIPKNDRTRYPGSFQRWPATHGSKQVAGNQLRPLPSGSALRNGIQTKLFTNYIKQQKIGFFNQAKYMTR